MTQSQAFIYDHTGAQGEVLQYLYDMLMSFPEMETKIRYRVPFFYRKSWICYLNPKKDGCIELCFLRANEMSNEQGLLDFKERTQVAGVTYGSVKEINDELLWEVVQEAILLDETVKYKSKRKPNN